MSSEEEQDPSMPPLISRRRDPQPVEWSRQPAALKKLQPHDGFNIDNVVYTREKIDVERDDDVKPATTFLKDDEEGEEGLQELPNKRAPPATRSIVENASLARLIKEMCACRRCKRVQTMDISFPSAAVATVPIMKCSNCGLSGVAPVAETNLPRAKNQGVNKATDFALNALCVMAFIASGDGGTEAQRVMAFLGLPSIQSMEKDTWRKTEKAVSPAIWKVLLDCLDECLVNAVKETMQFDPDFDFDKWHAACSWEGAVLACDECPELNASMDMGWQKKGSGRLFDSLSGHACLIDMETRKPIALCIKVKDCPICNKHFANGGTAEDLPPHDCQKNHDGGSGSMESAALLCMVEELFDKKKTSALNIATDDDSKMKARTKWSNEDYKTNHGVERPSTVTAAGKKKKAEGGKSPAHIPQPRFLADPAHRKKILKNALCKLLSLKKDDRIGFNQGDIIRLTTNCVHMINQLCLHHEAEWTHVAKAFYEHHFDNHAHCGDFCKRAKELEQNIEPENKAEKFYRNKEDDAELYAMVKEICDKCIAHQKLLEVAHGFDTNVNEALNNLISWLAPKNKTHCFSASLKNRVAIAVGIFCAGHLEFWKRVADELGIDLDPPTLHCLEMKEMQRKKAMSRCNTEDAKKKRNKKLYEKLRKHAAASLKDRKDKDGHGTGIAIEDETDGAANKVDDSQADAALDDSQADSQVDSQFDDVTMDDSKIPVCASCGQRGHKNSNNKKCINFKPRVTKKRKEAAEQARIQSMMDSIPLQTQDEATVDFVRQLNRMDDEDDPNWANNT